MTAVDAQRDAQPGAQPDAPSDYQLLLPDGWFRIDLDPERREGAVDALVERQFRGIDDAPIVKQQVREELRGRALEAYKNGGIELYMSMQAAGALTVPASLLVTLVPKESLGSEVPVDDLAAFLAERGGPAEYQVTVEELPAGTAVRTRARTVPAADDPSGSALPVTSVDYHVPVPGSEAYLLLSFSTPLDPIADAMADLFDAVALSLKWSA
ncbi:hypothetical protein [Streptomyces sp. H39-S7]|uniref:hypothetical protein n=1 Tax=Streptomyces sp. H39-S7 TaxID=3004357 RepID=UPI0022AF2BBE|nr:hypothetical protein [Streptomyces sp. H39-S7]MCZ4121384.1 hypothetical protein [Streptomyces sp. H39-S7]